MIHSITFTEFQNGIADLWHASDPTTIPIYNNPFSIIEYPKEQQPLNIVFRCVRYVEDGIVMGYSSIYNISDSILRIRGIYVLPEYRGKGVGHRMWREMIELFPASFYRVVGFWRESSYESFIKNSKMSIVPNTGWIWSEFSKVNMKMLYWDRGPKPTDLFENRNFISSHIDQYSMGGRANMNCQWSDTEWASYITTHEGVYPDLGVDLNF